MFFLGMSSVSSFIVFPCWNTSCCMFVLDLLQLIYLTYEDSIKIKIVMLLQKTHKHELINYSEHGTYVDGVRCSLTDKRKDQRSAPQSQFTKLVKDIEALQQKRFNIMSQPIPSFIIPTESNSCSPMTEVRGCSSGLPVTTIENQVRHLVFFVVYTLWNFLKLCNGMLNNDENIQFKWNRIKIYIYTTFVHIDFVFSCTWIYLSHLKDRVPDQTDQCCLKCHIHVVLSNCY